MNTLKKLLAKLDAILYAIVYGDKVPLPMPSTQTPPAPAPNPDTLLPWNMADVDGDSNNHHNVRVLCDLEGLAYDTKEILTACVRVESNFNTQAIHKNYAYTSAGVRYLASTDHGICQWNDWYHGKEITPEQATDDPEMAVRLMCQYFKNGQESQWISFSSGAYKQFLGKV